MAQWFECPYLGQPVELTDEREAHIQQRHAEILPARADRLAETLGEPDAVYRGRSPDLLIFSRWYDSEQGKHLLMFVVEEPARSRYWILTSRYSRIPSTGELIWQRS
jgi:hypothetical protein